MACFPCGEGRCSLGPCSMGLGGSRAEIGLGELQGGLQLLTSWGSLCSPTLLIGGGSWEGAGGAWEGGLALSEPGDPALQFCGGGGAAATAAPPSPMEERSPRRYFGQRLGCLLLDWFYRCCQRDGGEKSRGLRWGLGSAVIFRLWCLLVPIARLHPVPSLPSSLVPRAPEAQPRGAIRGGSGLAASRPGTEGGWPANAIGGGQPQIVSALLGNTHGRALAVICGAGMHWKLCCWGRGRSAVVASGSPAFSVTTQFWG